MAFWDQFGAGQPGSPPGQPLSLNASDYNGDRVKKLKEAMDGIPDPQMPSYKWQQQTPIQPYQPPAPMQMQQTPLAPMTQPRAMGAGIGAQSGGQFMQGLPQPQGGMNDWRSRLTQNHGWAFGGLSGGFGGRNGGFGGGNGGYGGGNGG